MERRYTKSTRESIFEKIDDHRERRGVIAFGPAGLERGEIKQIKY